MPLFEEHKSPVWGVWKIDETVETLLQLSGQSDEYRSALSRFTSESRKQEWLAVRLLLKYLLQKEVTIAYHDTGVPYLPDIPYQISISHTKGYAAVIVGEEHPVGIDIEYRSERVHRIKTRFMNEAELTVLGDLSTEQLLVCWSAKETAFKMMQERVVDLQTDLHIVVFDYVGMEGVLFVKETYTAKQQTYQINYRVTPDFVLTYSR